MRPPRVTVSRRGPRDRVRKRRQRQAGRRGRARRDRLAWELTVAGPDPVLYLVVVDALNGDVLARHSLTNFLNQATVYDNHPAPVPSCRTPRTSAPLTRTWLNDSAGRRALRAPTSTPIGRNGNNVADARRIASGRRGLELPPAVRRLRRGQPVSSFSGICTWSGTTVATRRQPRPEHDTALLRRQHLPRLAGGRADRLHPRLAQFRGRRPRTRCEAQDAVNSSGTKTPT